MKSGIHPTYYPKAKVKCACGATYELGSTVESYNVEICAKCHPFYTGKQKLVDTAGRVDKFVERQKAFEMRKAEEKARLGKKTKKETAEERVIRKAKEKEAAKMAEKAEKEAKKKEIAKKRAKNIVVKSIENEPAAKKVTGKKAAPKKSAKKAE